MRRTFAMLIAVLFVTTIISGCGSKKEAIPSADKDNHQLSPAQGTEQTDSVVLSEKIIELTDGLSAVRHFDWNTCHAMIIQNLPAHGYASLSTVNMDFIKVSGIRLSSLPDEIQALAGLYAPLDGVNEKGLAVSVNMIQDSDTIDQDTDRPDITTTTAVRLLLDRAASVEEAIDLLSSYDLRASFGYMVHFAVADREGSSVVVEYINNEMLVTKTPVVTNFYLAEGEKNGIGTRQSHERYGILMDRLSESGTINMDGLRDAMDSVSKDNFEEFESTEWSIVANQATGEVRYYHRENYDTVYTFTVTGGQET